MSKDSLVKRLSVADDDASLSKVDESSEMLGEAVVALVVSDTVELEIFRNESNLKAIGFTVEESNCPSLFVAKLRAGLSSSFLANDEDEDENENENETGFESVVGANENGFGLSASLVSIFCDDSVFLNTGFGDALDSFFVAVDSDDDDLLDKVCFKENSVKSEDASVGEGLLEVRLTALNVSFERGIFNSAIRAGIFKGTNSTGERLRG